MSIQDINNLVKLQMPKVNNEEVFSLEPKTIVLAMNEEDRRGGVEEIKVSILPLDFTLDSLTRDKMQSIVGQGEWSYEAEQYHSGKNVMDRKTKVDDINDLDIKRVSANNLTSPRESRLRSGEREGVFQDDDYVTYSNVWEFSDDKVKFKNLNELGVRESLLTHELKNPIIGKRTLIGDYAKKDTLNWDNVIEDIKELHNPLKFYTYTLVLTPLEELEKEYEKGNKERYSKTKVADGAPYDLIRLEEVLSEEELASLDANLILPYTIEVEKVKEVVEEEEEVVEEEDEDSPFEVGDMIDYKKQKNTITKVSKINYTRDDATITIHYIELEDAITSTATTITPISKLTKKESNAGEKPTGDELEITIKQTTTLRLTQDLGIKPKAKHSRPKEMNALDRYLAYSAPAQRSSFIEAGSRYLNHLYNNYMDMEKTIEELGE